MPDGYLVDLGANGALDNGDVIVDGLVTFTTDTNLGSGDWSWNGTFGSTTYTNEQEPGDFILATDGNVYFVPAFGPVTTLTSAAVIDAPAWEPSDTEVAGSDDGDLIDGSYADDGGDGPTTGGDTIHGYDGDDTIDGLSGDDAITGDGGDDSISGGGGNDTIFGDSETDAPTVTGLLSWEDAQNDEQDVEGGITLTDGPIDATISFTDTGNNNPLFQIESTDDMYVAGGEPYGANSALYLYGDGDGDTSEALIEFNSNDPDYSGAVEDVSFRINDFDFGSGNHLDTVTITALDADGNPVSMTLTLGTDPPITGPNQTISANTFSGNADDLLGSLLVEIAGPVSSILIEYSNSLNGTQAIWISDIAFDAVPSQDGDDTINGGAGDDVIDGQGGDDSIQAGGGDDSVQGGDGNDTILGQGGNDTLDGGDGDDTIAGGGNADTISGGGGNDTLTGGGGNDSVDGGAGNDTLRGNNGNDTLSGGTGDDRLEGGNGDDSLMGDTGADTVLGGAGDDTVLAAEGDSVEGGDGDDLFILTDLGESGANDLTINGGEGAETDGDVLDLNGLNNGAITYTNTDDDAGGFSGWVELLDGSTLTFTNIERVICFTPGTRILTPDGPRAVERLRAGDMVVTRDDGAQPVRWMGARMGPGRGDTAPIRIEAGGLFGADRPFLVSPQHRMLVEGYRAEMTCGEREVLVAAKHLVDGVNVRHAPCAAVTYIHMMFDRHQIVYAEGTPTESLHLGEEGLAALSDAGRADLFAAFPQYRADPGLYGPTARRCARAFEGRLLVA